MKFCILLHIFLVLYQFRLTRTQRRIVEGTKLEPNAEIGYMAYLLRAQGVSETKYDSWICGGAIVNDRAIITSAACIEDVQYMYAVVGHRKYVKTENIKTEECTKNARKRIVLSCVPKTYNFNYDDVELWSNIDIGVVFVDSAFDFTSKVEGCSWTADLIKVNYFDRYQRADIDAVVFGFGHTEKWRMVRDKTDYNQAELRYASVLLMDREQCRLSYRSYPKLYDIIDKYMICTLHDGSFDALGNTLSLVHSRGELKDGCPHDDSLCHKHMLARRLDSGEISKDNKTTNYTRNVPVKVANVTSSKKPPLGRRQLSERQTPELMSAQSPGFCQNDHGGPLVTWIGNRPHLIGVASVFLVNPRDKKCNGPYLYTSTSCNSKFLNCALKNMTDALIKQDESSASVLRSNEPLTDPALIEKRQILREYDDWYEINKEFCELPPEKRGFKMVTRRYSWDNHPDKPKQYREDLIERPQISLNVLRTLKDGAKL